jgi:hypothetical protein
MFTKELLTTDNFTSQRYDPFATKQISKRTQCRVPSSDQYLLTVSAGVPAANPALPRPLHFGIAQARVLPFSALAFGFTGLALYQVDEILGLFSSHGEAGAAARAAA